MHKTPSKLETQAEHADREASQRFEEPRVARGNAVSVTPSAASPGESIAASAQPRVEYEFDFYAWLKEQASLLRSKQPAGLDWENSAEEIEEMARRDRRELRSHLQNLLSHLLKWAYQPSHRSKSWATVNESRDRIQDLLEESPSLKNELASSFEESRVYARALRDARLDTEGKAAFPQRPPWTLDTILNPDFFPER